MFVNPIKEIVALNKIDLEAVEGSRLYYSVYKNVLSLIFNLILVAFFIYSIPLSDNILIKLLGPFFSLLFLYEAQKPIGRLMLKNPIFILNNGKLYYLKYDKWYDITEYKFSEEFDSRYNWSQSYCMTDRNNFRIFTENNWYFHVAENFKSKVHYQRLIKIREKRKYE